MRNQRRKTFLLGQNSYGILGNGTTDDSSIPVQAGKSEDWLIVDTGFDNAELEMVNFTAGVRIGTVSWKAMIMLHLTSKGSVFPATGLCQYSFHICGIRNGELYCWGSNHGQLEQDSWELTATRILLKNKHLQRLTKISTNLNGTCGIREEKIYCWGNNSNGNFGDGTNVDKYIPTNIDNSESWTDVGLGFMHSCGKKDNKVFCWGEYSYGQTGVGKTSLRNTPELIYGSTESVSFFTAGIYNTCIIKAGELYCWGNNDYGQIGDGTTVDKETPVKIGNDNDWSAVSTGLFNTCGINNGEMFCWEWIFP